MIALFLSGPSCSEACERQGLTPPSYVVYYTHISDPSPEEALDWMSDGKTVKVLDPDLCEDYVFLVNDVRRNVVKVYSPLAEYMDTISYMECVERLDSGDYSDISLVLIPAGWVSY